MARVGNSLCHGSGPLIELGTVHVAHRHSVAPGWLGGGGSAGPGSEGRLLLVVLVQGGLLPLQGGLLGRSGLGL